MIERLSKFALTILLASCFASTVAATHPYHVSLAEIELNPKTGNFEVALCVWPADLEKAIALQIDESIDLDTIEKLDEHLATYVSKHFRILGGKGEQANIRWVGHEKDLKKAWLYFEVQTEKSKADWTLENRIFFELNEDQSNQVNLKIGKKKSSLVHTIDAAKHALK